MDRKFISMTAFVWTIQHFLINLHLSVNVDMNQRELREDDYPQGFLESRLRVERISVL